MNSFLTLEPFLARETKPLVFSCICCWSYSNYMRQHRAVDDVDFDSINQSELKANEKSEIE